MSLSCFPNPEYKELLAYNRIHDFDDLWALDLDWVEEPNQRRNGWSGIVKHTLMRPDGGSLKVYIKKQSGHNCRTLTHLFTGIPTFRREYMNLISLPCVGVRGASILYYGDRHQRDAVLVLESLEDFTDLDDWNLNHVDTLPADEIEATLHDLAGVLARMHQGHFQHGCLYGKHVFIRIKPDGSDDRVRLIDMEKMRRRLSVMAIVKQDMQQFIRRTNHWRPQHLQLLLDHYAQQFDEPEVIARRLQQQ